jgi:hypothetical protein
MNIALIIGKKARSNKETSFVSARLSNLTVVRGNQLLNQSKSDRKSLINRQLEVITSGRVGTVIGF